MKERMELITNCENIAEPYRNAVLTIGNFDGVHLGHQALFAAVKTKAQAINGTSIAMTFEPHPSRVLKQNGHPPLITLYERKMELIADLNMDVLICIPFTKAFASISADEFIEDLLVGRIGMKAIVVGEDYTFGRNREGNLKFLRTCADRLGFEVIVGNWVPVPDIPSDRVSSTRIREMVMAGQVSESRALLGRNYQIRGTVESGRDRGGRLLGFPTANIRLTNELCPQMGVYAVTVKCLGKWFKAVANIGYSPTFDDQVFTVEAHILDFDEDIYGEDIRVNFISRIRDEMKFSGIDALVEQIRKDIVCARTVLRSEM